MKDLNYTIDQLERKMSVSLDVYNRLDKVFNESKEEIENLNNNESGSLTDNEEEDEEEEEEEDEETQMNSTPTQHVIEEEDDDDNDGDISKKLHFSGSIPQT